MDSTRRLALHRDQKGFALVYVALSIFVLFGFLGLAVDAGHLYVVRGELQNAADASALAGAWSLYRDPSNPDGLPSLDWGRANTAASDFINKNNSDGAALANATIEVGYWPPLNPDDSLSTTQTSPSQVPAVRVSISRSAGSNGGPVSTFFMKVLDTTKDSVPVSSRPAVAVSGYPGDVPGGILFPMALSSCMADTYFKQDPLPSPPTKIVISSLYTPGGEDCISGQWTALTDFTNGAAAVKDFITNGTSPHVQTGDPIWIQTGKENSLFKDSAIWVGKDVLMPIVSGNTGTITKDTVNKALPVQGFALFHIDSADNGSDPNITGYFIDHFNICPGTRPGGSVSNTVTPPLMVQ